MTLVDGTKNVNTHLGGGRIQRFAKYEHPERLFKVLGPNRQPLHGGTGQWPYRKWTPRRRVEPCVSGWHVVELDRIGYWLTPDCRVWEVELRGEVVEDGDKWIGESARLTRFTPWDKNISRLCLADCVEYLAGEYGCLTTEVRASIEVARAYARGACSEAVRQHHHRAALALPSSLRIAVRNMLAPTAHPFHLAHSNPWVVERIRQYLDGEVGLWG